VPAEKSPKEAQVTVRYCKVCAGDVEEVDGHCLLGHALKLAPPIPSVAEMRDEVSRALGEARIEARPDAGGQAASGDVGDDLNHLWEPRAMTWSPPPPVQDPQQTVWGPLAEELPMEGDPITAFAPASRMDWGPDRSGLRARNPLKRKAGPAPV
jgi:hypothetical protein